MIFNIKKLFHNSKFILLGFLLLVSVAKGQVVEPPYKTQLIKIEERLRTGDLRGAMTAMDQVLSDHPQASEVYYAKGLLFGQLGNYEEALANAKLAYTYSPNLMYANLILDLYRSKQNWPEAIALLNELYLKYPEVSSIGRDLMLALSNNKALDKAVLVYENELKKAQSSDTLAVVMAEVYVMNGELKPARKLLEPLDKTSVLRQVYGTLGYINLEEGKTKQAIAVLERGITFSKDPLLYLDLADAYKADNKMKQVFESLKKAFDSDKVEFEAKHNVMQNLMRPDFKDFSAQQIQDLANSLVIQHPRVAESHVIKGEVLWRNSNTAEARSLFLTAVGLNPRHVDAWRMLINTDLALNAVDDAIRHANESLRANPGNPLLMYFSGLAFMVKEDKEKSRLMLEMALDHSEEENSYLKSLIYSSLGDLYHQLKMASASDVAYEEAIQLDSLNITAMNNLAYYLSIRKKDLDKAAQYAKRANELEPNSPTFQDTYAWVLFQQGDYKEAGVWMEKAIKNTITPSAVLHEHYGDILINLGREKEAVKHWEKALALANGEDVDASKIKLKIKDRKYVE